MNELSEHYLAHPYFIMGAAHERAYLLEQLKNNEEWMSVQDVIDALENGE